MREGQLHATICFTDPTQAVTKAERPVCLRVSKQFQKYRAMNIVALDTGRGARNAVNELAKRCPQHEACVWRSYRLDPVCEANPCRSTAFSASSLIFDLIGAAKTARTKHRSPIIPPA
jgi:hypothetical protein